MLRIRYLRRDAEHVNKHVKKVTKQPASSIFRVEDGDNRLLRKVCTCSIYQNVEFLSQKHCHLINK
jgi:hypothetical protein